MLFNLTSNIQTCFDYYHNYLPLNLIYYSHIPAAIGSLIVGFFVFINGRKLLLNKLLFSISLSFSVWVFLNLITWTSFNSAYTMFAWSLLGIFNALISVLSLYFIFVFLKNGDLSTKKKLLLGLLLLPTILLTPTNFNLTSFDAVNCQATEWPHFSNYYYLLGLTVSVWILIISFLKYKKTTKRSDRIQILLLASGIEFFLLSFFTTGFLNSYLVNIGYITDVASYNIEFFGLFGMTIFMGFLAYLIVKYQTFNVKLISSQALIFFLAFGIGSQFFFIQNNTSRIINGVTFIASLIMGYFLVKSVKAEAQRKEELQHMSNKLAQTNDQLRKLDNAKSEFISIASHQLRTPLTAIKGFLSLLLEGSYGKLDPKHTEVLSKVYISNERLITLVEDLLNISRIESGRMEFKFDKWDIEKMCHELIESFALKAKDNGLYLDYKKPTKKLSEAMTDGSKLREVISNLIDNAIKYTPRGGVAVRLSEENGCIRVTVTDTGIGIPPNEIQYLFSKFSRGKDTARLNTGGTGLGLYVGRSMMESLSGKIWAESDGEGKGSRFIVEIPIERNDPV